MVGRRDSIGAQAAQLAIFDSLETALAIAAVIPAIATIPWMAYETVF
jgi:hypothetical protein